MKIKFHSSVNARVRIEKIRISLILEYTVLRFPRSCSLVAVVMIPPAWRKEAEVVSTKKKPR